MKMQQKRNLKYCATPGLLWQSVESRVDFVYSCHLLTIISVLTRRSALYCTRLHATKKFVLNSCARARQLASYIFHKLAAATTLRDFVYHLLDGRTEGLPPFSGAQFQPLFERVARCNVAGSQLSQAKRFILLVASCLPGVGNARVPH